MASAGVTDNAVMEKSTEMSVEFAAPKPSEEMLPQNAAANPLEDVSPKSSEASASKSREVSPSILSESTSP